ncbi:MAG: iron-sulfur cluster assembly accessory protein [Chloroflexi bacterium]|nr:iron-sulfur cluster assembly accessory protein [Chloroflexota bacterium]MDA1228656.1 iron-sulfur cluster assembly accessory protein [Chloroflexota bacterium]
MANAPIIDVTEKAAQKLGEIIGEQGGEEGSLLRMMVVPGPQGSFQYMLGMEKAANVDDFVIQTDTVQVLVDPESAPLVEGAQIDYVDGLMRSGFVISNPNFQNSAGGGCGSGGACGCGAGGESGGCGSGGESAGGCGSGGGGCACGGH